MFLLRMLFFLLMLNCNQFCFYVFYFLCPGFYVDAISESGSKALLVVFFSSLQGNSSKAELSLGMGRK